MPSLRLLAVATFTFVLVGQGRAPAQSLQNFIEARNRMVSEEIIGAGIKNPRVIDALRTVPRHEFVPLSQRKHAYYDMALPIGESQTISSPFIVAFMTEQLDPQVTDKVLEIGTGSGYQAAVLSRIVKQVFTIEIVAPLSQQAGKVLQKLGYDNVYTKIGDGYQGWAEYAPFDKIIVTCSPEGVPAPLAAQLKEGGRMVIPVGERYQQTMYLLRKKNGKLEPEALNATLFVPMTGAAEDARKILPDPTKPALRNGDFEETFGNPPQIAGWHYVRQATLVEATDAPSGTHYLTFKNSEPGRGSQALQGFPVDGRKVKHLEFSVHAMGKDVRPAQKGGPFPRIGLVFYDENRTPLADAEVGLWRGTFPWRKETQRIAVPVKAREAIVRIGLLGTLGELSLDDLQVIPQTK